jgi:hypothetical protein
VLLVVSPRVTVTGGVVAWSRFGSLTRIVVHVSHLHPLAAKAIANAASAWMRNPKHRAFAKVRVHRVRLVMFFKDATEIRASARLTSCLGFPETRPRLSTPYRSWKRSGRRQAGAATRSVCNGFMAAHRPDACTARLGRMTSVTE